MEGITTPELNQVFYTRPNEKANVSVTGQFDLPKESVCVVHINETWGSAKPDNTGKFTVNIQAPLGDPVEIKAKLTGFTVSNSRPGGGVVPIFPQEIKTSIRVLLDTVPPTVRIEKPSQNESISLPESMASFQLRVRAEDVGLGVEGTSFKWYLDKREADQGLTREFQQDSADGNVWIATVNWPDGVPELGEHTINVRVSDKDGNLSGWVPAQFQVVDGSPPLLLQTGGPQSRQKIPWAGSGTKIDISGTATDWQSGVASVTCQLFNNGVKAGEVVQSFAPGHPGTQNWTASFSIATAGWYRIECRCKDHSDQTALLVIDELEVAESFKPADLNDLLGFRQYLEDLLTFIKNHFYNQLQNGRVNLDSSHLTAAFYQDFEMLSKPGHADIAYRPMNQVRRCIEVLRKYMIANKIPQTIEPQYYASPAYLTLLHEFGTSYDELRLTFNANEETRRAVAARLGIERHPKWSFNLNDLLLTLPNVSESDLDLRFGLRDTSKDPVESPTEALLLQWQLVNQELMWLEQDRTLADPILDPDIIGKADLVNPLQDNPIFRLWSQRVNALREQFDQISKLGTGHTTALDWLTAVINGALQNLFNDQKRPITFPPCNAARETPLKFLQCLEEQRANGINIQPALDALFLDLSAFRRLIHIVELSKPAEAIVLDEERESVIHILVQVWKGRQRQTWRDEEKNFAIIPGFFNLYRGEPPSLPCTGIKDGALLADGVQDPQWILAAAPAGSGLGQQVYVTQQQPDGAWVPNTDRSHWISPAPNATAGAPSGSYIYRTAFDLSGWDLTTIRIIAKVAVDDLLTAIKINGTAQGELPHAGYDAFTTIVLSNSLLKDGPNTLEFVVNNAGNQQNPTGIRVELSFAAPPRRMQVSQWRMSETARNRWQAMLQARIDEQDGLRQAFNKAIQTTEQLTLPLLRDALVTAIDTHRNSLASTDMADWLSERLLIETKGTGWRLTTRIQQAIETLQSLVFSLRTQRFEQDHPATNWSRKDKKTDPKFDTEDQFDEEWQWAGNYETWRAAMLVFYYPENILLPSLREPTRSTVPFKSLLQSLRARSRLTPEIARKLAMEYLNSLRGVSRIAYWTCDEQPETSQLSDASGNANHGMVQKAKFTPGGGKFSGAIEFDGTNLVEISHSGTLALGRDGADFSVAFWFQLVQDHNGAWRCIMHKGNSTYQRTFALWMVPNDNRVHFRISTDLDYSEGGNSSAVLTLNAWYHIAYVKVEKELRLYINGVLDSTAQLSGTVVANDGPIYLGKDPWHPGIVGRLDDIQIYDIALPAWMVTNIANSGQPVPALSGLEPSFILTDQRTEQELTALRAVADTALTDYFKENTPSEFSTAPMHLQEVFYFVPMTLALHLQKSGEYTAALDWFQTMYAYNLKDPKIYPGLRLERNGAPLLSRTEHWMREFLNPHQEASNRAYPSEKDVARSNPYTRYTLMSLARCFLEFADAEFTDDTGESLARARSLYFSARRILTDTDFDQIQPKAELGTLLPNPVLGVLRTRIDTQLAKLQQGRNIAGMKRELEVPTPPTTLVGLPTIGSGGQLVIPGARRRQKPTPYRFAVLMERAKQLVGIAQQIEATYLSALEKRDSENYTLKRAGFDLQLAEAGNTLQTLRETEAMDSETIVVQQKAKATKQKETYRKWIDDGLSTMENAIIGNYITAGSAQIASIWLSVGLAVAQAQASASPATTTAPVGVAAVTATGVLSALKSGADSVAIGAKTAAEVLSIKASHERRVNDWQLAYDLADIEEKIADQQAIVARDHTNIVRQEKAIAQLQSTQATAMANFLGNKFTSAELYEWMSGVLAGVYNYFLQQATGVAMLAENQLTFERQEAPTSFIQNDYWEAPSDGATANPNEKGKDRRGLTGSARLLQDIYQLDQYAFEANKRKLNLTHTLSLAMLDPYAFAVFRDTGVLNFQTPMRIFDEAFPGHYLRLIKRVRTSVVALIPPVVGIRATLTASGVSRVIMGGDVFQETTIRRDPELVALSSPVNATGVFELDAQSELLMPFESMGVDTRWEFAMPRASNPFDFQTIADILVTIEYTALFSDDYRQQVIQNLDLRVSADKAFSIRSEFPDIWYDLVNSEQGSTGSSIRFRTERGHFPPNLADDISVGELLFAVLSENEDVPEDEVTVSYTPDPPKDKPPGDKPPATEKGQSSLRDKRIHTRLPSGWGGIKNKYACGQWNFDLPASLVTQLRKNTIDDILIVLTFKGTKPSWPT